MQREHVKEYDVLRVLLTLLVVLGHAGYTAINFGAGGVDWPLPDARGTLYDGVAEILRQVNRFAYSFHMPLFFVLSGAVSALGGKDNNDFALLCARKARRLLVPYLFYGLLFMLPVKWLSRGYSRITVLEAAGNLLTATSDMGHLWFLVALFWCFMLYYAIHHLVVKPTGSVWAGMLVAGILQSAAPLFPIDFLGFSQGLSTIFWFALGHVFEASRPSLVRWLERRRGVCSLLVVGGLVALLVFYNNLYQYVGVLARVPAIGLWLFLACRLLVGLHLPDTNLFRLLLHHSMNIYLFHDPLEYLVLFISFGTGLLYSNGGVVTYALARTVGVTVVSILLGAGLDRLKKRWRQRHIAL